MLNVEKHSVYHIECLVAGSACKLFPQGRQSLIPAVSFQGYKNAPLGLKINSFRKKQSVFPEKESVSCALVSLLTY